MSEQNNAQLRIEPERYEFRESPMHHFDMDRRDFFKLAGAGIAVFVAIESSFGRQQGESGSHTREGALPQQIGAWLHIREDGTVTVFTGKVEMGQNIRTSLTQAVAEELRVQHASIHMLMGDTSLVPFDSGTFGSRTTPQMGSQLRHAANAAKEILIGLAAKEWNADRAALVAENGKIRDTKGGREASYAELARGQSLAEIIPSQDPLRRAEEWTVSGRSLPKVDGRDFVTGRHRYTSDLQAPGMLYGKIVRPWAFGAALASVDASAANAMPGVVCVVDGDFVGVAAPTEELAARAAEKIRVKWKIPPAQPSDKEIFEFLRTHAENGGDDDERYTAGSMDAGLAAAAIRLRQTYTAAYIAHAPLEPRAALAEWRDGTLHVLTGTQLPFGVRAELAKAFNLSEDRVRVEVPDTGSAYGGKHTGECATEAARLARAAGRPVKLVWTRQEEFTWAYFRPATRVEISSGVRQDGTIAAWEFHNYNGGDAGIRTPYDVPNQRIAFHPSEYPLRQGSYRGIGATVNHFARESHMDELARESKLDPLEFRRRNLKDVRLRTAFEVAAKAFGWGAAKSSPGQGFGIAGGVEKGGRIAMCAHVQVDQESGAVKLVRMVAAFECGAIVNPEHLRNQIEGSMVMGLGGALFEAIGFADGRIKNARFSEYRVPRFSDAPKLEVVLIDRKDLPSAGAGETPIVGVAPVIANAIFDATGVRLRAMPLAPSGVPLPHTASVGA